MKVTKKTERISKTEQSTKTYRVTGDEEDKNHQFITVDKTITLPLSDAAKEDVDKNNTPKVEDSNPFESNEKPLVEDEEDKEAAKEGQEATNEDDPKNQEKTKK